MHESRTCCWQDQVEKMLNSSGNVSVCSTLFCFHFDIKYFLTWTVFERTTVSKYNSLFACQQIAFIILQLKLSGYCSLSTVIVSQVLFCWSTNNEASIMGDQRSKSVAMTFNKTCNFYFKTNFLRPK